MDVDSVNNSQSGKSCGAAKISGSSLSTEATLESMGVELAAFEKSIGKEILATKEKQYGVSKSSFSFNLAGRKSGQNDSMESRGIHSESFTTSSSDQETSSIDDEQNSSRTLGDRSTKTKKISNLLSDVPEIEELDSDSSCSVSDDEEESQDPHIEYKETNANIDSSGSFEWFDRFVREGDFCIDYACRMIECDPSDMYMQTKTNVANFTHLVGAGEVECSESEDVPINKKLEEVPEDEAPKKNPRMSWFSLTKKSSQIIESKNADPALDDLTDSDSWMSEASEGNDSDDNDEKLLSSSPDVYFENIKKSSNREGDANEEEVRRILYDGRVMCEV